MSLLERSLYRSLISGANSEGWALYRIGDGTWGKKPCDIGGADPEGNAVCLEVKVVEVQSQTKPLPWKRFTEHQIDWLDAFSQRRNALALVGIYEERVKSMTIYPFQGRDCMHELALYLPRFELCLRDGAYLGWNIWRPQ